jgi:hypothetical protein
MAGIYKTVYYIFNDPVSISDYIAPDNKTINTLKPSGYYIYHPLNKRRKLGGGRAYDRSSD